ncbi:MAG TPA: (5-formylfuran-3-yl)methyl phosphate synthase [Vicinamibacterales bacterium]|nr:(5-formylfuran-3-yl)methyl phosphate synthase [Vicinamibacterales bacterium]
MKLLVSVRDAAEAAAALAGGADIVDAKDPAAGALGPVTPAHLRRIVAVVNGVRPVTAALGDASEALPVEQRVRTFRAAGARFVKLGFAGVSTGRALEQAIASAVEAAPGALVAVAYADAERVRAPNHHLVLEAATEMRAAGVLLDTADKSGPGLRQLIPATTLRRWVETAHAGGLFVALAGKLRADDLLFARDVGADIAGVRGAACVGAARDAPVVTHLVRRLAELVRGTSPHKALVYRSYFL